jgi:hypothetical protein
MDERITRILELRLEAERQELTTKLRRDEEGAEMAKKALKGLGNIFARAVQDANKQPDTPEGSDNLKDDLSSEK